MAKLKFWGVVKVLKQNNLQVTLPKEIVEDLGIRAGDRLRVDYDPKGKTVVYSIPK